MGNMKNVIMGRNVIVGADETVSCPNCRHGFALEEGISRQTIDRYAEDFERTLAAEAKLRGEKESAQQVAALKAKVAEAELTVRNANAQIAKIREDARKAAREAVEVELKSLQEAGTAKDKALADARDGELGLRRRLREAEDARRTAELTYQRKLDEERKRIAGEERAAAGADADRRVAQMRTQLEQAQREAADLKRKLEQGSQQVQGEALETGLAALLREAFPLDRIEEVPKGVAGADLVHRVCAASGQVCGTILWESKQTKGFSPAWLQKLKDDQRVMGAEIAVIVTAAMPKDCTEPFVRLSDVWVASRAAARPVAEVLRTTLIEMHKLRQANAGRSEKMELLYNYVCSPQFAQRMKAVVDSAVTMRKDLEEERRVFARIWQKREKQIDRLADGMLAIVGDLQGIGEGALPQLDSIAALPRVGEIDEPVTG